ncbi:hypothetical protein ACFZ8E_26880 [Methylobacterium sp. HMF5984]|uniref:hypothetical protein n=1 Tax=Methylobacterium sp. HMF5984 TaxID=3367370 RepID=UPI0038550525
MGLVLGTIMEKSADPQRAILRRIADKLGVPVEQFFTGNLPLDADDCLRLWLRIKTDEGRRQALEALRAIAEIEQT